MENISILNTWIQKTADEVIPNYCDEYLEVFESCQAMYEIVRYTSAEIILVQIGHDIRLALLDETLTSVNTEYFQSLEVLRSETMAFFLKKMFLQILGQITSQLTLQIDHIQQQYLIYVCLSGSAYSIIFLIYTIKRYRSLLQSFRDMKSVFRLLPPEIVENNAYAMNLLKGYL